MCWCSRFKIPIPNYRFPTVIDIFPIEIFRSRYTVISNSFSRPTMPFPLTFPVKKIVMGMVKVFSRPFPTVYIPKSK
jgi:hypothetical protein